MHYLAFSALLLVLIVVGCNNKVCDDERGKPAPIPLPHAGVTPG
ncbi:hypothetical protein [Microbulbifer sp.]